MLFLRLILCTLRGFLAATGLTLSMFLPAFRLVRQAETNNARAINGTGIVEACHKVRAMLRTQSLARKREFEAARINEFDNLCERSSELRAAVNSM